MFAGEPVVREPVQGGGVDDRVVAQPLELGIPEPELGDRVEQPPGAGHHAVAAAAGRCRANTSNTQRRLCVPARMAASSIVSS